MSEHKPLWLSIARELYSISQAGLTYSHNEYDKERYRRISEIAAGIIAGQSCLEMETIQESFRMQAGYATPKIDVRCAAFKDGKILLVRETSDGCWTLPGGWADIGDSPSAVAIREVREESGFEVQVDRLIAIHDANRIPGAALEFYHAYKLIFLCTIIGGEGRTSNETSEIDFFDPMQLPPLSVFRTNQVMIDEILAQLANPCQPVIFD